MDKLTQLIALLIIGDGLMLGDESKCIKVYKTYSWFIITNIRFTKRMEVFGNGIFVNIMDNSRKKTIGVHENVKKKTLSMTRQTSKNINPVALFGIFSLR
eukprot:876971_1